MDIVLPWLPRISEYDHSYIYRPGGFEQVVQQPLLFGTHYLHTYEICPCLPFPFLYISRPIHTHIIPQAKRNLAGGPATVLFGTPVDASEMPSKEEVRKMVGEAYAQGSGTFFPEESEWGRWW